MRIRQDPPRIGERSRLAMHVALRCMRSAQPARCAKGASRRRKARVIEFLVSPFALPMASFFRRNKPTTPESSRTSRYSLEELAAAFPTAPSAAPPGIAGRGDASCRATDRHSRSAGCRSRHSCCGAHRSCCAYTGRCDAACRRARRSACAGDCCAHWPSAEHRCRSEHTCSTGCASADRIAGAARPDSRQCAEHASHCDGAASSGTATDHTDAV